MGDFDFIDSGAEYVWVDTPGYEFVDRTDHIIRLKSLQTTNVSIIYGCRLINRGDIMHSKIEIYLGGGNIVDLQLTAQNADTGEISPLTPQLMAMIERCKLALGDIVIDSAVAGLGTDQPFDPVTNADSGILSLSLGEQTISPGAYPNARLSIKFTNAPLPKIIQLRREVLVFPAL